MIDVGNFFFNPKILKQFSQKSQIKIFFFAFTYDLKSFVVAWKFQHEVDSYSVDSDEAMKRGNEALNTSLFQFFRSGKCFIAFFTSTLLSAFSAASASHF